MERIPLQPVPNQEFPIVLGGNVFNITVQLGHSGGTLLSVSVNDEVQVSGLLCPTGSQMMQAPRNELFGNLAWSCADGASYPDYKKFGTDHNLFWWPF